MAFTSMQIPPAGGEEGLAPKRTRPPWNVCKGMTRGVLPCEQKRAPLSIPSEASAKS